MHNYPYDDQQRSHIKRQRSDSDYNSPHGYPAYVGGTMQQYGMPTNSAYGLLPSQPPQTDPQAQMGSMMTPVQQGMMSGWQRSQAPYSAPVGAGIGMSGGSYFGSGSSTVQTPRNLNYGQQTSSQTQYGGRGSNEFYSGLSSLPTPVSEQGLSSAQPSIAGYGQSTPLSVGLPPRGQPVQQYDLSNASSQYPSQPGQYSHTSPQYHTPTSNVTYEPQQPQNPIKAEASHGYSDSPHLYNAPPQNAYPGVESFSSTDLPLSSGMLNREFSGAYPQQPAVQAQEPGTYAEMPEQDLAGYHTQQPKSQQPAAYPTPHQTSPTHLRDHG